MKRILCTAAAIAFSTAAAFFPTQALAEVSFQIVIGNAPPPPRYEVVPGPRQGYVWSPGYWNWDGRQHAWVAGHWENSRRGQRYQRSEWRQGHDGWRLTRGGWQPVIIVNAPPPPRYEALPRPRKGQEWAPGHWTWTGHKHKWTPGHWEKVRAGHYYQQPVWQQSNNGWYMAPGGWQRGDRPGNRNANNQNDHGQDDRSNNRRRN
jgi:hypothetical protein